MIQPKNSIDETSFKSVLGGYVTGVTIVTTLDNNGNPHGFTANSFNSVSLNPPLISFCLHNSSSTLPHLNSSNKCTISILNDTHEHLAKHFAFFKGDKFADMTYDSSPLLQYPLIQNALGWLECEIINIHPAGDHFIFICQVVNLNRDIAQKPLIYYSGNYNQI